MFSRRRSRGHYDPAQYNTGIRTPSASASAAANAFYSRQLGPSAAAEAIRRHSLDQSDADAMRNFRLTPSTPSAPRRTYSLSNSTPPRRTNSLSSRSHQVVYNSPQSHSQPHTQMPSQQPHQRFYAPQNSMVGRQRRNSLNSNSGRSNSLTRTETVANRDSSGRTLSLTTTTIRQMGSFEIVTSKDISVAPPLQQPRGLFHDHDAGTSVHSIESELGGIQEDPEEDAGDHIPIRSPIRSPVKSPMRQQPVPMSPTSENSVNSVETSEGRASLSDVSDATPSPPGSPGAEYLVPPVPPQSKHRESSPARSALRQSTISSNEPQQTKAPKVSFGGDKEFVYESYDYENEPEELEEPRKPAGLAAATAAARARHQPKVQQPQPLQPKYQSPKQQPKPQPKLVMSQPPLAVTKRASEQSLRSKRTSTAPQMTTTVGGGLPYPQARSWDTQNNSDDELQFVDAPDSSMPNRGAMRSQQDSQESMQQNDESANQAQLYAQALALAQQQFNQDKDNSTVKGTKANTVQPTQNGQPKHYYRSLLAPASDNYDDDDAASMRSDSSFTRQSRARQARPNQTASSARPNRRMKSLRQPETPTLRTGQDRGRKGSLLSQPRPQMVAPSSAPAKPQAGGFRSYSLRQQGRPDPATLLSGAPAGGSSSGGFKSRVADSDSEDEGFSSRVTGVSGGGSGSSGGKITLGDMFSPNTDVKDIFKSRSQSEQLPKQKKSGFFKRMFAKRA